MKRVLLTGIGGFVGHHVAAYILETTDWEIVGLDRCANVGTQHRLMDTPAFQEHGGRMRFVCHDLRAPLLHEHSRLGEFNYILHLAASSHVNRSIERPLDFVLDNVAGTTNVLDYARAYPPERMLYFSTDEVFGPAGAGVEFREWDRYHAGNPYAATKAGAEELCVAYHNTYKLPVFVTHCMNVFGERQHPEKYIPLVIRRVLAGEQVQIHADPTRTRPGSRFYIHARDVAEAVLFLLERSEPGDKYNIRGTEEVDNLRLAQVIADLLDRPLKYELVDFHSSRPGHDLRYALDGRRLMGMGFKYHSDFESGLKRTVGWYEQNRHWLE